MKNRQSGQTLIETMAAAFVLVMGITAVAGLASFSLSSSSNVIKQVVGMGLAREGIEAVKNMRDTNWLQQSPIDNDCFNFKNGELTAPCYGHWLDNPSGYFIRRPLFTLSFNPVVSDEIFPGSDPNNHDIKFWHPISRPTGPFTLYGYPLDSSTKYFYDPVSSSGQQPSGYYRSVSVSLVNTTPFDQSKVGPAIRVTSRVWWGDKKCPTPSPNAYPTSGSCRITLETILTNWKTN